MRNKEDTMSQWQVHPERETVERRAAMIAAMTCDDCCKDCDMRGKVRSVEPWSPLSSMYSVGDVAPLPTAGGHCGRLAPHSGSAIELEFFPVIASGRGE